MQSPMASEFSKALDIISLSSDSMSSVSSFSTPWSTPPRSPMASVQTPLTPPTSPLNPGDWKPKSLKPEENQSNALQTADDTIYRQRRNFFLAIRNLVMSLLGDYSDLEYFGGVTDSVDARILRSEMVEEPVGLAAILKPHQRHGLEFLVYLRRNGIGGILADDMGLGKTLQTLALFQHVKEQPDLGVHEPAPFLVVCPLSVMKTWLAEIDKWTPGMTAMKFHGTAEEREKFKVFIRRARKAKNGTPAVPDIVITSYETLVSDIAWFQRAFVWKYVVLDEGHRIKNGQSRRAQIIGRIRAEFKLVLTGTPIQNNLKELWSILNWLYPEVFVPSTEETFDGAFSLNDGRFDRSFLERIKRLLNVIMLRRDKDTPGVNLNIPPKTETIISVPLSHLQHSLYLRILTGAEALLDGVDKTTFLRRISEYKHASGLEMDEDIASDVADTHKTEHDTVKRKIKVINNILMELRKCSIHPYMLDDAIPDHYTLGPHIANTSGKFVVLQKFLEHFVVAKKKKVVIFSGFDQTLNLCEDLLSLLDDNGRDIKHVRLDGKTCSAMRNLSMHLFQNDPRYMVFLVSIRAGGEGLNLISSSTVIFLDEDWNPQVMKQAESRVHRIGQKNAVEIFRVQSKGTVEEQMARRLVKKAYLATTITDTTDRGFEPEPYSPFKAIGFSDCFEHQNHSTALCDTLSGLFGDMVSSSAKPLDPKDLNTCDWKTVLERCVVSQKKLDVSQSSITVSQEKAWMERSARVRTNLFNGETVDTSGRSFSVYKETIILDLCRADRRVGKQRTVMIDGFAVSKDSLIDHNAPASPGGKKPNSESRESLKPKVKLAHEKTCFSCHRNRPIDCIVCPRAFHEKCLEEIDTWAWSLKKIVCPHHFCSECGKKAAQAGGLLYPCISCMSAYCEDCLDWMQTKFIGENHAYQELGYDPNNAFYIECVACAQAKKKRYREDEGDDMARQTRRSWL